MKIISVLLLFASFNFGFGQKLDFDKFELKRLAFFSTKSEIIEIMGEPNLTFEPNYDCGGLSAEWQGYKIFTLDYGKITLTGNEASNYLIERVDFENDSSIELTYGQHKLNCDTRIDELSQIFGKQIQERIDKGQYNGVFSVLHEERDDGILLDIKDGKLIQFRYWTPC